MGDLRIGILGGTFDPIHTGHLIPAEYACGHLRIDTLYLVPSAAPVHRPEHTPAPPEHRFRMCELAAASLPRFVASDVEIMRTGPSYTILTLEHFARVDGPQAHLFLLVGEDNLPLLHTWHRISDILAFATLAILPRPTRKTEGQNPLIDRLDDGIAQIAIDHRIPGPLIPISSTEIRRRLRQGQPIDGLVPASVAAYISHHGLYRA